MKTALIIGATGMVGKECLYRLLESKAYLKVISMGRRPLAIKHQKLEQVMVSFDQPETFADKVMADDIFCCLGTTIKVAGSQENFRKVDYEYPLLIARLALKNGASHFLLVSAMGADPGSSIFYNRVKGEVERDTTALGYKRFSVFRPSLLLGYRQEFRLGERIATVFMKGLRFLFSGPLKKYRAIEGVTVARAMVYVAEQQKPSAVYLNDEIFDLGKTNAVAPKKQIGI